MADAPRRGPRRGVLDRWRLGVAGGSLLHVALLWVMIAAAAATAFAGRGDWGWVMTMVTAAGAALALMLGRVARVTLLDLLLAMTPRDNLLLVIGAGVAMAAPMFANWVGWDYSLSALMIYLCPLAVHKWGTARLMAVAGVAALVAISSAPMPPLSFVAAWLAATLLAIRTEAMALRLEAYAPLASVPVTTWLRETVVAVIAPLGAGVGLVVWLGPLLTPYTRYLLYDAPMAGQRLGQLTTPDMNELFWDTVLLATLIGLLIAAIVWFEKQLGGRRKARGTEVGHQLDASESRSFVAAGEEALPLDTADDVRGRILARFRRWLAVGERVGHPRSTSETPAELLARFGRELDAALDADPAARELVERAAYSHLAMSDEDEAQFDRWARDAEPTLREAAARRAAARVAAGEKK